MSMVIPMDDTVVAEGGSAAPLPDGTRVLATIMPTTKDGTSITKRPYANQGANANIGSLAVRFRIADGQRGSGRNVFANVPLARKFAATGRGKYPDGSPAWLFFQFFRSLGFDVDQPQGFALPDDRELLGREVELVLGIEENSKGELQNNVKFINKANGIPANTAAPQAATAQQSWAPSTTPAAQPAAASPWTPDAADVAHAQQGAWTPQSA